MHQSQCIAEVHIAMSYQRVYLFILGKSTTSFKPFNCLRSGTICTINHPQAKQCKDFSSGYQYDIGPWADWNRLIIPNSGLSSHIYSCISICCYKTPLHMA